MTREKFKVNTVSAHFLTVQSYAITLAPMDKMLFDPGFTQDYFQKFHYALTTSLP